MNNYILLDGVSNEDKGLVLSSISPFIMPRRTRNREPRLGMLTSVESTYWQYQATPIKVVLSMEGSEKADLINRLQFVSAWILNAKELRTWYDVEKYYIGAVEGDIDVSFPSMTWAQISFEFLCNPPCWHFVRGKQSGWRPTFDIPIPEQITAETETVSRTDAGDLPSVTYEAAHPAALYFAITGTWTTLAIGGGAGLVIPWETPQSMTLYIDCDAQVVYHKLGGTMTSVPFSGEFPQLTKTGSIVIAGQNLAATVRMLVIERG